MPAKLFRDLDRDEIRQRLSLLFCAVSTIAIYLGVGFCSYIELTYFLWGQTAQGQVTQVREYTHRSSQMLVVDYQFIDCDDRRLSGEDEFREADSPGVAVGQKIDVRYVPKTGLSRIMDGLRAELSVFIGASWCIGFLIFLSVLSKFSVRLNPPEAASRGVWIDPEPDFN